MSNRDHEIDNLEEIAAYCFRRLAALEARFIILCHRASAVGIECTDLCADVTVETPPPGASLRVMN